MLLLLLLLSPLRELVRAALASTREPLKVRRRSGVVAGCDRRGPRRRLIACRKEASAVLAAGPLEQQMHITVALPGPEGLAALRPEPMERPPRLLNERFVCNSLACDSSPLGGSAIPSDRLETAPAWSRSGPSPVSSGVVRPVVRGAGDVGPPSADRAASAVGVGVDPASAAASMTEPCALGIVGRIGVMRVVDFVRMDGEL